MAPIAFAVVALGGLLEQSAQAELLFQYAEDNQAIPAITRVAASRIYGDLDAVTAVRFLTDPAPPRAPTILPLDAYDSRIVWRYYEPAAHAYGSRGFIGGFLHPHGIVARSSGEIYVADTVNDRVVRLFYAANQIAIFGSFGSSGHADSHFRGPRQVCLDRQGNVYVADTFNSRIQKFDHLGNPLQSFMSSSFLGRAVPSNSLGSYGFADGQFVLPMGVTVSYLDGSIFVADAGTNRLQKFDSAGHLLKVLRDFPGLRTPLITSLESDLLGRVYAVDSLNGIIHILDSDLNLLDESHGDPNRPFGELHAVTVEKSFDASGNWFSDGVVNCTEPTRLSSFRFPDVLDAFVFDQRVWLNWHFADLPNNGIFGYFVYRATGVAGPYARIATLTGRSSTGYMDWFLQNRQAYYYRVSISVQGPSESSPTLPLCVVPNAPPVPPPSLVATGGEGVVDLAWVPPPPISFYPLAGYDIYRGIPGTSQTIIGRTNGANATLFQDDTAVPGVIYPYHVASRFVTGSSWNMSPQASAAALPDHAWLELQHNAVHDGSSFAEAIASVPRLLWGRTAGSGIAVVGKDPTLFAATSRDLRAIDMHTGATLWQTTLVPGPRGVGVNFPAVSAKGVFVLGNGTLNAFEPSATLAKKWAYYPVPVYLAPGGPAVTPTLGGMTWRSGVTEANGVVYFSVCGAAFAVGADDGKLRWNAVLPGFSATEFVAPPVATAQTVYFLSATGKLAAYGTADYDPVSGMPRLRFAKDLGAGVISIPAMTAAGAFLYVPTPTALIALDKETGRIVWTVSGQGLSFRAEVAVRDGNVYAVTASDAALRCYSATTGTLRWSFDLTSTPDVESAVSTSAPALDIGSAFYVANVKFRSRATPETRLVRVALPLAGQLPALSFLGKEDIGPTDASPIIVQRTIIIGSVAYGSREVVRLVLKAPSLVTANQPLHIPLSAVDASGQVVDEFEGTISLTSTDPLAALPSTITFLPADRGVKVVPVVLVTKGSTDLKAVLVAHPSVSAIVTVKVQATTGVVQRLVVSAPQTAQSVAGFSFTVAAKDRFGNTVTGFTGTLSFSSTDPLGLLPPDYVFTKADKGVHVFSATLFTVGDQVLDARDISAPRGAVGQVTVQVFAGLEYLTLPGVRALYDMDFYGSQNGWIVGSSLADSSSPLFIRNTGAMWTPQAVANLPACTIFVDAIGVSVNAAQGGWAEVEGLRCEDSDADGFLYQQVGGAWQDPIASPPLQVPIAHGIALTSSTDGWLSSLSCFYCSGPQNVISRYDGTRWLPNITLPSGVFLNDFRFVREQPTEGWAKASGVATGLYRYKNNVWLADTTFPYLFGLLSLWMNSPTDLWGGTFSQVLVHYDGTTWTQVDNPAPYGAAFNAIHFFDSNHGVAVGSNTGSVDRGHPVIEYFVDGTWHDMPVMLPANLVTLGLNGVRMISQTEAWAYGAAFDMQTGNLEEPMIVHIHLPAVAQGAAPLLMAQEMSLQAVPMTTPGSLRIVAFSVSMSGRAPVPITIAVNEPCNATLTIYSSAMRPVVTASFSILGTAFDYTWDGEDAGTGLSAAPGWYTAVLDISSSNGTAERISLFPILGPGQPSLPIANAATRRRYLPIPRLNEHPRFKE